MRRRDGPSCSLPRTSQPCCGSLRARLRAGARPARSKRSESDAGGAFHRRRYGRWFPRRFARSGRTAPGGRPTRPIPPRTPESRADQGSAAQLKAPMGEDGQRFPAWPLITAVVRHSQRTGSYTARIDYPSAPARLLSRTELQPLRGEVISQVQRWTNDEWHKPVRLEVDDPDGRWLLGIPRAGAPVELDALAPAGPPPAALPTPARYRPHTRSTAYRRIRTRPPPAACRPRRRRPGSRGGRGHRRRRAGRRLHHRPPSPASRWPHRDPRRSRDHRCAAHPAGGHGHPPPVLNPAAPPGRPAGAPPRPRAPR